MTAPKLAPVYSTRSALRPSDIGAIRDLVARTGMFTPAEVDIAAELVEDNLRLGAASEYRFVILEAEAGPFAYACYGPTPGTDRGMDLYWIAVAPSHQGQGYGRILIERVEQILIESRARHIVVETSATPRYLKTRQFYDRAGYRIVAQIPDFYREGDGKVIYMKVLGK